MGKYQPLAHYLKALPNDSWDAGFGDIERILGGQLPSSAYQYPAWWANQDGHHSQTKGWRDAGWETSNVDLPGKRVRFVRRKGTRSDPLSEPNSNPDLLGGLLARARDITGIEDRNELLRYALETTIRHDAAQALIALGGSDPSAAAPPRRRFW